MFLIRRLHHAFLDFAMVLVGTGEMRVSTKREKREHFWIKLDFFFLAEIIHFISREEFVVLSVSDRTDIGEILVVKETSLFSA